MTQYPPSEGDIVQTALANRNEDQCDSLVMLDRSRPAVRRIRTR
jgi:hypothetical protein